MIAWPSGVNGIAAVVVKHQRIKENRSVVDERLGGIMTGSLDGSLVGDVVGPEGGTIGWETLGEVALFVG